mgnify:CR=1 FL=1
MRQSWEAQSEVTKNDHTYLRADYQIDPSLLWSAQFQGRIGNTRLALTYLKDEAKEEAGEASSGQAASEASEYLIGTLDFQGLFSPSSGLRVAFRRTETEGLAKIDNRQQNTTTFEPFTVDYNMVGLYQTRERGWYWGLEYTEYQMPSAVGFSDSSKTIVHSTFDPEFGIQKGSLVAGYDPQAYAKRYETDYDDFYLTGKIGVGYGQASLSSEIKQEAKNETGETKIKTPSFFAFDGMLETGYLWQSRFKSARGLGYQFLVGYQALGSYMGAGQSEDSESEEGLSLEFSRYDIWHGPFARLNIIF